MKKTALIYISILFLAVITTAFVPSGCLQQYWGTKKLYQPADTGCALAPQGYEPIFINYVGRHGARHLTSLNDLLLMQQTLNGADSANALTDEGVQLKKMINNPLLGKLN